MGVQFGYTSPSFFLPADRISAWYSPESGFELSGSYVTRWNDKSGNDNHLTASSPDYAPFYDPSYQGSLPSPVFDGINNRLDFKDLILGASFTTFIVYRVIAANFNGVIAGSSYRYFSFNNRTTISQGGTGTGTNLTLSQPIPADVVHIGTHIKINGTSSYYLNNTDVTLISGRAGVADGNLRIVGSETSGGNPTRFFNGPIFELIIVTGSLSPEVISNVNQSLMDKYISLL